MDLDAFEYNIRLLPKIVDELSTKGKTIQIRPHYKTHKCPSIAVLQKEMGGASGICCAKITEAESLVFGSQSDAAWDILITNEVVCERNMSRILALVKKLSENPSNAHLGICVDDLLQIDLLAKLLSPTTFKIDVYIELNVGQERCGVDTPDEVLELAQRVISVGSFCFQGLLAYNGSNQHNRTHLERAETVTGSVVKGKVAACLEAFRKHSIECPIVTGFSSESVGLLSGGGTGSFPYEIQSGVFQEIQPVLPSSVELTFRAPTYSWMWVRAT